MNKNDIFDTTVENKIIAKTNPYVNILRTLMDASKYFDDVAEPEFSGSGGSSNESHNLSSAVSRLERKKKIVKR
jgi:hypothetical protein